MFIFVFIVIKKFKVFSKIFGIKKDSNSYIGKPKERRSKKNKKERWVSFPERLYNALESNVYNNDLESLKENLSYHNKNSYKAEEKLINILISSIRSGSKECAEYLLSIGVTISNTSRYTAIMILADCKYDRIIEVYNLLEYLRNKHLIPFEEINKKNLVMRLIDPSKIDDNRKRVDYLLENSEFFGMENIERAIEEIYTDKPEKKARLSSIIREIKLRKLGI